MVTHTQGEQDQVHTVTLWLLYMYIPYNFNEKFVYNELTKHTCRMWSSILPVHVSSVCPQAQYNYVDMIVGSQR